MTCLNQGASQWPDVAFCDISRSALQPCLSSASRLLQFGRPLPRDNHLNYPMLSLPLCLNSSLRIDFQCAPTVRVPHKFLHHLHVFTVSDQYRGKAVPERVPADMLLNSGSRYGRPDDAGKNDIWPIRVLALGTRAREHPIVRLIVRAVLFPGPKFGGENWIHGHRFLRGFCFAIANNVPINRALNDDLQVLELDVSPLQAQGVHCASARWRRPGRPSRENTDRAVKEVRLVLQVPATSGILCRLALWRTRRMGFLPCSSHS